MTVPSLPPGRLEESFPDHQPLYSRAEALAEANRCLYCHDAPCIQACPTHIDIPSFIRKIATENLLGSARTILSANLLGYSCARVCPVEVLCVGACVYNLEDVPPIAIGRLQRYATEAILREGRTPLRSKPAIGKRVALVGAGPASLSCAGTLALHGVDTTVFEKRPIAGGLNATGIAPYKMTTQELQREIAFIASLGVKIETGVEIDAERARHLLHDFDAVFLGVGLGGDRKMRVPGEDGPGVQGATAWIERLKTEPGFQIGDVRRAVVVGGGNTALDAVRELAQLLLPRGRSRAGTAPTVTLIYRRTEYDMPAYRHEREGAKQEGVRFLFDRVPIGVKRVDGRAAALVVAWSTGGEPLRGTEEEMPADLILVAIGQGKLADLARLFPGVEVDERNRFVADPETGRTGNPKVYVGGDAFNGGREVVNAAQEGKIAAQAILRSFGGNVTLITPPPSAAPFTARPAS